MIGIVARPRSMVTDQSVNPRRGGAVDVAIRDAGLEEVAAIAKLERQLSGRYSPEFWRELLATSAYPMLTFCAEDGGEIVGFLVAQVRVGEHGLASETGWLTNMGVAPERQREGIGRALLAAARQRLRDIGVAELWGMAPAGGPVVSFLQREQFDIRRDLVAVQLDVGGPA